MISLYLEGEELNVVGANLLAIGAFISAVGETGAHPVEEINKKLIRDGNAVQAVGNTLQGVGRLKLMDDAEEEKNVLGMVGTFVQASGNTINSLATNVEIESPSEENTRFNSLGSTIQSMGAALEATGVAQVGEGTSPNLELAGLSLITLGTILDSIGVLTSEEKEKQKRILLFTGGWVEFVGTVLIAYAINK
ncbi:DUF6944 family repetitive protein [Robertmurraya beringensis]|uniref:DUF6944 family repetitive protein n=1 Tax=Robertmurraya beringensis TaxID=641660 RepID=A0ABV6KR68_9BACI